MVQKFILPYKEIFLGSAIFSSVHYTSVLAARAEKVDDCNGDAFGQLYSYVFYGKSATSSYTGCSMNCQESLQVP